MEFNSQPILSMKNITYFQENNCVLSNIDLDIHAGTIHAIVGDHGSGKTYLSDIFSGVATPDSGTMVVNGKNVNFRGVKSAHKQRIYTVHQDVNLIENFTVAENLYSPEIISRYMPMKKKKMFDDARILLRQYGLYINPETIYKNLPLSDRILVNIVRNLFREPQILILDEALERLTGAHIKLITPILNQSVKKGMAVVSLSHKIDDVYNIADFVTIIRNGQCFLTDAMDSMDRLNLIKLCYSQLGENSEMADISREFYQLLKYNEAILQKLPINLVVTDDTNRIKMINETGKKFFSVGTQKYRDITLSEFLGKGNISLLTILEEAFQDRKEKSYYNIPLNLESSRKTINIRSFPIYDGAFLIGNIFILEDITEQEQMREQMNLSEKLASVGLLAAGVAHEINNPLEIIFTNLSYLSMNEKRSDLIEVIGEITEEIEDIKQIVSNLISFSDNKNSSVESCNLVPVIESLINLIRFNAKMKNIRIHFENDDPDIKLRISKNEFKQVLLNLLKNSFEAMSEGGDVYITTGLVKGTKENSVYVDVMDTGPGIDDLQPGNIFLPFYSTKKSNESNLGLGLSVIYGIIRKYKGKITVENLPDKGCNFHIELPQNL